MTSHRTSKAVSKARRAEFYLKPNPSARELCDRNTKGWVDRQKMTRPARGRISLLDPHYAILAIPVANKNASRDMVHE